VSEKERYGFVGEGEKMRDVSERGCKEECGFQNQKGSS
jgi:hypothetical protein